MGTVRTPYERIMARAERTPDGCLTFMGSRTRSGGYGQVSGPGGPLRAHRVVWEHHHGPILDPAVVIRHRCDNPPCVAIEHLEHGTRLENNRDMHERGRYGFPRRTSKIPPEVLEEIRAAATGAEAARATGVSASHVSRIRNGHFPTSS